MVRSSQATTFSSSPYFFDRGAHGTAQPITERINVKHQYLFKAKKKVYLKERTCFYSHIPDQLYHITFQKALEASILAYVCFILFLAYSEIDLMPFNKERHPMKPHRLTLTNALVMGYGLDKQIHHIYDPRPATKEELENYHDSDYIDFLSKFVTPPFESCSTSS